jgi:acyl-CoA reductase-like NAD-dependent aldehyde dehydrogenase
MAANERRRRARWLGKWRDWMLDHRDELLTPLQLETGKS